MLISDTRLQRFLVCITFPLSQLPSLDIYIHVFTFHPCISSPHLPRMALEIGEAKDSGNMTGILLIPRLMKVHIEMSSMHTDDD